MPNYGLWDILIVLSIVVLAFTIKRWIDRRAKGAQHQPGPPPASGRTSAARPGARDRLPRPFADVERQVKALRQQVQDGLLTEAQCKARMRELMVEDANGDWWMVGYETGKWYRHDGVDWVQANPPLAHDET